MDHSTPEPRRTPADDPSRFTLGTFITYPDDWAHDGKLTPAVRDEQTGSIYRFISWDAAKAGIAQMREKPETHFFAPERLVGAFTPAAPGVDEGAQR